MMMLIEQRPCSVEADTAFLVYVVMSEKVAPRQLVELLRAQLKAALLALVWQIVHLPTANISQAKLCGV